MFERYTEKARRVIFFARYEASQFGSPHIESEHLLLGLMREDKTLVNRFFHSQASIEAIRKRIEAHTPPGEKKISTSVDLPLSQECKRVLTYAAEEAERLGHKHIGTEHLLLGLLREEKCFAATILHERGFELEKARSEVGEFVRSKAELAAKSAAREKTPGLDELQQEVSTLFQEQLQRLAKWRQLVISDLLQAARANELDPLIGREVELDRLIRALCRRARNNAVLIGEPGVGKKVIVHGLAQRIADDNVPSRLQSKRLVALDISTFLNFSGVAHFLKGDFFKELGGETNVITFVDDAFAEPPGRGAFNKGTILRPLLTQSKLQCIAAAKPSDYQRAIEEDPWLKECFNPVEVPPPDEAEAIRILAGLKTTYEKYYGVTYTDEALKYAVLHSQRYMPGRFLPEKAVDLMDEAGAAVTVQASKLPAEMIDAQKRLKFVINRFENAVASHEFEKAKFYSDEERKERENLRQLREKYKLEETPGTITLDDIEKIVSQWTGVPLAKIQQERQPGESQQTSS